jgi:hypothetical protein
VASIPSQCVGFPAHTHAQPDSPDFDGYLTAWDSDHISLTSTLAGREGTSGDRGPTFCCGPSFALGASVPAWARNWEFQMMMDMRPTIWNV